MRISLYKSSLWNNRWVWELNVFFLLGYVNEVGEVFRFLVLVVVVWLSYGVVSFYVLVDVIDKGKKAGKVSVSFYFLFRFIFF